MANPLSTPLPPLRDVISRHGLRAKRSLGQHFLLDQNLTDRIARTAGELFGINVIEVGAGPGGLTRALLVAGAGHVTVLEKDRRCIDALAELQPLFPERLSIIEGDAREVDLAETVPAPRRIVANLPYNISTVLLIGWLRQASAFQSLTLMFQKEVADRLAASPGTKAYGRLSVMTQWLCEVEHAFDIDRRAFTPPPAVTSSVVHLRPRSLGDGEPGWSAMERVARTLFGQRRKMLRTTFRGLGVTPEALGLDAKLRAENLGLEDFRRIAQAIGAEPV